MQREILLKQREQQLQTQLRTLEKLHRELQVAENRWSYALQGNGDAVWDWNIKKDEIFLSYRFYEMLGFKNMNGSRRLSSVLSNIHASYRSAFEAEVSFCTLSPYPSLVQEILIKNQEESYIWVMVRGKVVEVDESTGESLRMVGTMTDLSSIKLMKRELSIYEEMIKQNQTAILLTDLGGHIEFMNETAGELLGYHEAETLYHQLNMFDAEKSPFSEMLAEGVRQSGGWSDEVLLKIAGTREIETHITASLLRDEHDEPYGIVINIKDISERITLARSIAQLEKEKMATELNHQRKFTEMMIQVQENEKIKLAKELHDGIGQMLNLTKLHVETAQTNNSKTLPHDLNRIKELLVQTLRDVKSITHELTPLSLQQLGLQNALLAMMNCYQEAVQEKTRFQVKIDINEDETPIPETLAMHIYRIAQETVSNAIKYAQAKTISLMLIALKNKIHLLIEDDGVGFHYEEERQKSHSFGLKNLQERSKLMEGRLLIDTAPGSGCTISITIPLAIPVNHTKSTIHEN
ncbi:MAG: PAS domain-containing protein [Cyclobacteriaceae bacterium]